MSEYRRPRHRAVARVLEALSAAFLADNQCYFGGGTRIALELDEYRESQDVDFLCADLAGYRAIRSGIGDRTLGKVAPRWPRGLSLLRDVRADQYGVRTVIGVEGEPVKFEIILEARISLTPAGIRGVPVATLDRASCFAEKWLANADRWNDASVLSRDAIDLAFMLSRWNVTEAKSGAILAEHAYGDAVRKAASSACLKLLRDAIYRKRCAHALAIVDAKPLSAGLKRLKKLTEDWPSH